MSHEFLDPMPDTPGELLAIAVKRDVLGRLEAAMLADAVIAEYIGDSEATVHLDVVIDRTLGGGELEFESWAADNTPFSPLIGQPAVAAMVTQLRSRILNGQPTGLRAGEEPVVFEIAIRPDAWAA